ncbi:hypothetical protein [Kitasatospora cheerisanensis]|uniref:Deoxyxylulose-5-phosphate synthase n=1 Tax=Kitasatospora cheerisanensis KCTC 2395 TaxID=1348663 RepID=A0A066YVG9_9ACTN|nr:hypothetical protein [Kitasatospora cheerisanensis]KDN81935.1 hypothetical protein KCH_62520 [Kitasatospora cheerisanensis KCTC 2395]
MAHGKTSYVCLPCRASYKQRFLGDHERRCPRCAGPLLHAGSAFAAPRRRDTAAWQTLTLLLGAGVGFHKSCCGGPGYRPRSVAEAREWLACRERTPAPLARRAAERSAARSRPPKVVDSR